ncbi:MAG: tetratricopeptide repeat protein [Deltaproteobacteria bacterium]|nr:tetratricopeptide repeat protein [Deltaproteobacteria bacterium]
MSKKRKGFLICLAVSLLFLPAVGGQASPKSQALIQQGHQHLTKQHFERALKSFEAAAKLDPQDGQALFFQGVALNRLGRFHEAGKKLDQSEKLGTHPDWAFERGWAHLGQAEFSEAVGRLKAYEKKNAGRGQTSEFIGRAYFGLGDAKKARRYFDKALKQNPGLKQTVNLYLAAMERSPQAKTDQKASKPWGIFSNLAGTYNTNAINLGNGATLPTDVARQDSTFASTSIGGNYRLRLGDKNQLAFGHQFLGNAYEVSTRLNMMDNFTSIQFRRSLNQKQVLGITVSNDFTIVQTAKFRNQIGFRPVFGWQLADWLTSEGSYAFGFGEYFFPSNANQDRDGHSHVVGLSNYLGVPNTKLRFLLGYNHLWNRADGADFDFQGNNLNFAVSHPLFWEVTAELFFSQGWNRFDNVNSLTANTMRSDDVSNVFTQINFPIHGGVRGFLRTGYMRNKSNINTFNSRAHQGNVGILVGI